MEWDTTLRIVGVIALVAFAVLSAQFDVGNRALLLLIVGLIAVVAPEGLDRLPFGPDKE